MNSYISVIQFVFIIMVFLGGLYFYTKYNNPKMLEGLTAKVWRTYNASVLFQKELDKVNPNIVDKMPEAERINYLISVFNQANTAVALLCNHQKNVSSNIEIYSCLPRF